MATAAESTGSTGAGSTDGGTTSGVSASEGSTGVVVGTTDGSAGTSGGACSSTDILVDGSFEAGTPSVAWTEASDLFGTPLCDEVGCGNGGGAAGPSDGAWWAWFGGASSPDNASLAQTVAIDVSTDVSLTFDLWIGAVSDTVTDDHLDVFVDGDPVFAVTTDDAGSYAAYTQVVVDLTAYADGGEHVLTFSAQTGGGSAAVTNFNVDNVALGVCL